MFKSQRLTLAKYSSHGTVSCSLISFMLVCVLVLGAVFITLSLGKIYCHFKCIQNIFNLFLTTGKVLLIYFGRTWSSNKAQQISVVIIQGNYNHKLKKKKKYLQIHTTDFWWIISDLTMNRNCYLTKSLLKWKRASLGVEYNNECVENCQINAHWCK